ncbi:hypothetical protein ABIB34_001347 [Rhodococcus sp. UYP5]
MPTEEVDKVISMLCGDLAYEAADNRPTRTQWRDRA